MFYVNAKYLARRMKIEEFVVRTTNNELDVSEEKMPSVEYNFEYAPPPSHLSSRATPLMSFAPS